MNGSQLIQEVRVRLRDQATPYLWSDAQILAYLNEAQRVFCERTHALVDYDCYSIQTAVGVTRYELDPEILAVPVAKVSTETSPLDRLNTGLCTTYTTNTGLPRKYSILGGTPSVISLYPAPDAVYTVQLAAAVRPTEQIQLGSEPQIGVEYHMQLTVGAIIECLIHQDADGYAPDLLDRYEERWAITLRDAKREVYRRLLGPNNIANIPSWTGG